MMKERPALERIKTSFLGIMVFFKIYLKGAALYFNFRWEVETQQVQCSTTDKGFSFLCHELAVAEIWQSSLFQ